MKRLTFLGGAAGLGLIALLVTQRGYAADHMDSPIAAASPMADINDVYTWMDGANLNLAMSISPEDVDARAFGPDVQYVFHVHSKAALGTNEPGTGSETRVICTFASSTSAQCWITEGDTTKDYIAGDPSNEAGITSKSGKVRMFAGRRSDPYFFNLQGFRNATSAMATRLGRQPAVTFDAAGCPDGLTIPEITSYTEAFSAQTPGQPPCSTTQADCFAELNVRILLVQLDKALVNAGSNIAVGVWASTHAAP